MYGLEKRQTHSLFAICHPWFAGPKFQNVKVSVKVYIVSGSFRSAMLTLSVSISNKDQWRQYLRLLQTKWDALRKFYLFHTNATQQQHRKMCTKVKQIYMPWICNNRIVLATPLSLCYMYILSRGNELNSFHFIDFYLDTFVLGQVESSAYRFSCWLIGFNTKFIRALIIRKSNELTLYTIFDDWPCITFSIRFVISELAN